MSLIFAGPLVTLKLQSYAVWRHVRYYNQFSFFLKLRSFTVGRHVFANAMGVPCCLSAFLHQISCLRSLHIWFCYVHVCHCGIGATATFEKITRPWVKCRKLHVDKISFHSTWHAIPMFGLLLSCCGSCILKEVGSTKSWIERREVLSFGFRHTPPGTLRMYVAL
jgi:hypothetical protein